MKILLWILLFVSCYVYIGYPLALALMRRLIKKSAHKDAGIRPHVSLIIAAYNEESVIRKRLENILSLTYPKDKLEVLIVSDSSSDKTDEIVHEYEGKGITLLRQPLRKGKMAALNMAVSKACGEIFVFSDADTFFKGNNIEMLVRNFVDPQVGCVSGRKIIVADEKSLGATEGLYWKYESFIKESESALGSLVGGVSGCNFAIRRELFETLDERTTAEDLLMPLLCLGKGYKVVADAEAIVYEILLPSAKAEFKRKIRIVTGGIFSVIQARRVFGSLSLMTMWQLWSHKILRWCVALALPVILVINCFVRDGIYGYLLIAQIVFYSLAVIGSIWEMNPYLDKVKRIPFFSVPYYFISMNVAGVLGILKYVFRMHRGWVTYKKAKQDVGNEKSISYSAGL